MKKYLILSILILLLCLWWVTTRGQYGEFGDGATPQDTVPIFVQTWDSLGFSAPADTVWIWRYILGITVVDSTVDISLGNAGTGQYLWKRKAYDGTHYGAYRVSFKFRPFNQGDKYYTWDRFYIVYAWFDPDSLMNGRLRNAGDNGNFYDNEWGYAGTRSLTDKAGFSLSGTQTFSNTGTWTGNLSGSVGTVSGSVGSVAGNVGGNIVGSVGSVGSSVNIISNSDILNMASLLGGRGNRMLDYYNASGKLDSAVYFNNATRLSKLHFWRTTATGQLDSMTMTVY